ncbi:MAG: cysteine desulfurase [Phycisphaeraceae bacterium]|nr:cysteine desulfurase [Phycisphaeraceae bacterium]MCB9848338.1 cysteine desulfurase [Phycisphaeraceae bacterium]
MIYLDNNATTRPDPEVISAMSEMLTDCWHNPSSIHRPGQRAKGRVEMARRQVADLIGAQPAEIIFTSGGTESINAAIRGACLRGLEQGRDTVISTAVEHHAVSALCEAMARRHGMTLLNAPLDEFGVVDARAVEALIDDRTALVAIQWANNETGAIHPIERIACVCRERDVLCYSDATQWIGKMPTDVRRVPVDMLTLSGHKFHGPKGAGALYLRKNIHLAPLFYGSQERSRRGGTENTSGCVGLGVASAVARAWMADPGNPERVAELRDRFERAILERIPGARVNGPTAPGARLWNTSNIAFPDAEAEILLLTMSEKGLCASGGSACSSGSISVSPVLTAMGLSERRAGGSVRFSLSKHTTDAEIDQAIRIVQECHERTCASAPASRG